MSHINHEKDIRKGKLIGKDQIGKITTRRKRSKNIDSAYKGVYLDKRDGAKNPWKCHISLTKSTGKSYTHYIGSFPTAEEAHLARIKFITDLL